VPGILARPYNETTEKRTNQRKANIFFFIFILTVNIHVQTGLWRPCTAMASGTSALTLGQIVFLTAEEVQLWVIFQLAGQYQKRQGFYMLFR
jgi:hypothetical protein